MINGSDVIELTLPFKADYVSIARLTVSGISARIGFDIETIEDIKVAVAEVCNKLVERNSAETNFYKIIFSVAAGKLDIKFSCDDKTINCLFEGENQELGISIINALMDNVELCSKNSFIISMSKSLEVSS